jgi:glycosyltransferase involved in cell wall biosynthesis
MAEALRGLPNVGDLRQVESGVDLAAFRVSDRFRGLLPSHRPLTVGYLGRLSPEKNPLGFVRLAEEVVAVEHGIKFVIFGSGVQEGQVREQLAQGEHVSITLAGWTSPAAALQQVDVLIVPSLLDGRPAVIMEASASGVPVIAAPVGAIPEMIVEGVNGWLRAPTDVGGILMILRELRDDRRRLRELKRSARGVAEARFDRRRMMDDYAAAFSSWAAAPARSLHTKTAMAPPSLVIPAAETA